MSSAVTVKDTQDLRKLIPLNILSASRFESLCSESSIEEAPRGSMLFSQGDAKNEFVYVLSGTVSLQAGGMEMETISAGTESARFALAHQIPRKVSAVAKDRVRFIRVDAAFVNQPNESAVGGVATYEVNDIPEDAHGDWVTTLLKSPIFQRLPPANLQSILSALEEITVEAGQEIIHQDEPGDYYYVIKQGRCALTRKPSRNAREIKLAELKTCDTFGEDSLISDQPRNVTVTMMTAGVLLRLNKENFLKLVKEPVIAYVSMEGAERMIHQDAIWLDVRSPDAFMEKHLPEAVNIPFFKLRMELANLDRQRKYILVCETGRVSESAAFLLIRYLFDAYVLKGGISAVFRDQLVCGTDSVKSAEVGTGETLQFDAKAAPSGVGGGKVGEPQVKVDVAPDLATEQELLQARASVEMLAKENRTLKLELTAVRGALADLQNETTESQAVECSLREQLRRVDAETAEARARCEALSGGLDRLRAGWPQPSPIGEVGEMECRLVEMEAGRQALEAELSKVLAEKMQLERELRALREVPATANTLVNIQEEALQKKNQALEEVNAEFEREKRLAEERIQELEQQIAELSAVVQEFVNQQSRGDSDEVQSLRAELETIRSHATGDVMSMQIKLRAADQEIARLRGELESAHQQLLMRCAHRQTEGESNQGGAVFRKTLFGNIVYSVLVAAAGAAMLIAVAAGTDAGHGWTKRLVAQFEQGSVASPGSHLSP